MYLPVQCKTHSVLCHCIHLSSHFTCKYCNFKISHLNERQHRTCSREKNWVEYPSIPLALPWALGGMYHSTLKSLVLYLQKMQKWSLARNKKQQRAIDLQDGSWFFFRQGSHSSFLPFVREWPGLSAKAPPRFGAGIIIWQWSHLTRKETPIIPKTSWQD